MPGTRTFISVNFFFQEVMLTSFIAEENTHHFYHKEG